MYRENYSLCNTSSAVIYSLKYGLSANVIVVGAAFPYFQLDIMIFLGVEARDYTYEFTQIVSILIVLTRLESCSISIILLGVEDKSHYSKLI